MNRFLTDEKRCKIIQTLIECSSLTLGPANVQKLNLVDFSQSNSMLSDFLSVEFKNYLQSLTGLKLDTAFLQCFQCRGGDYSLLGDWNSSSSEIDVFLRFFPSSSPPEHGSDPKIAHSADIGGEIIYIDGQDTLLSIPVDNLCAIVYRDEGVSRFMRFVSQAVQFYDICMTIKILD